MATAFKEYKKFYQKIIFGMKANFCAKFEVNLKTSTYQPLHDFYMNLYLTSSLWNQRFEESVDLMVCVVMVYPGENRDWIGPWMTFCGLPKITVDMSFYMPFLLFRYLDWSQSWMRQIEEVYAIQIDLRLRLLWHFRLISSFPAYHHFLLKHSSSKLSSLIRV